MQQGVEILRDFRLQYKTRSAGRCAVWSVVGQTKGRSAKDRRFRADGSREPKGVRIPAEEDRHG
jgi:hypothetical protein